MTYEYKVLRYIIFVLHFMFFILLTHVYGRWYRMMQRTNTTTTTISQICNMFDVIKLIEFEKKKLHVILIDIFLSLMLTFI